MRKIQRLLLASTAVLAVGAFMSGGAYAQARSGGGDASAQLEEIIVTSTKRAERLQDVPVSVTALTQDVIERNNVRELGDLVKLSPAISIDYGSQPGNFSINMAWATARPATARRAWWPKARPGSRDATPSATSARAWT